MPKEEGLASFVEEFIGLLEAGRVSDKKMMLAEKRRVCERLGIDRIPKNGEISAMMTIAERKKFSAIMRSKPVRIMSGVTVAALMTKPYDCPHGVCIFCPGGTKTNTPQSYTGFEPAARRAALNAYDPYTQINSRLNQYIFMGYSPQKVEAIIIGGTFTTLPKDYRRRFITLLYKAINDFPNSLSGESELEYEKIRNEKAATRLVALAIETKPERCGEQDIRQLLDYGVTRVEMGVQSVFDDVLRRNNRGHTITDVKDTTARLKDSAYKVDYHIMLNLPSSDIDKDRETISRVYTDESFKPDAIKIYPTLVIKGTGLYKLWIDGKHKTYSLEDVIDLVAWAEINAPAWIRIMRVERDIPSNLIEGGIKVTNLRQLVHEKIRSLGKKPRDIRGREVGHVFMSKDVREELKRETYRAAHGDEVFLSIEDAANDALIGFLRLRIPDGGREALVRELHVYGEQKNLSSVDATSFQHKGVGAYLLREAERIARQEYSLRRGKIISGVGVREYYRKNGYSLEGAYMCKAV